MPNPSNDRRRTPSAETLFETGRLLVRRADPVADMSALLAIFGDPANVVHFGAGRPWSEDEIRRFLAGYPHHDPLLLSTPGLVFLKPQLQPIGFGEIGYYRSPGNTPDLFFVFRHPFWGRGYATELARAALEEAFHHLEIDAVHATVKPANAASVRVLEKCGFIRERYLPDADRWLYRAERRSTAEANSPAPFVTRVRKRA